MGLGSASVTATMFGVYDQVSVFAGIAALPIALWELSLGIWLVAKGLRPDGLARLGFRQRRPDETIGLGVASPRCKEQL